MPVSTRGLLQSMKAMEELTIEATVSGNYDKSLSKSSVFTKTLINVIFTRNLYYGKMICRKLNTKTCFWCLGRCKNAF